MNVGLVVIAYNSGHDLTRLFDTALVGSGDQLRLELFLHSNEGQTVAACEAAAERYGEACNFHDIRRNVGVSRSWNEGALNCYRDGADVVVVANDDILFGDGDLPRLARAALDQPDRYAVLCGGFHSGFGHEVPSHGFSCFAWNPVALEVLGCFDENLFPAYFEDCDYSRRAVLAGLKAGECAGANVVHEGSSTIKRDPERNRQNHVTFAANSEYYQRKWGGGPHHEENRSPFNEPGLGLLITPERRHYPYGPEYDRTNPEVAEAYPLMAEVIA